MCGCNKNSGKKSTRGGAIGPGPSIKRGSAVARTPSDMRVIEREKTRMNKGIPGNVSPTSVQKRLLIEKKRRSMILKKLGR